MLETIVAPATPYGESSIGVIRISGSKALEIVKLLTKTNVFKNRYAHYRKIYSNNDIIDDAIVHGADDCDDAVTGAWGNMHGVCLWCIMYGNWCMGQHATSLL